MFLVCKGAANETHRLRRLPCNDPGVSSSGSCTQLMQLLLEVAAATWVGRAQSCALAAPGCESLGASQCFCCGQTPGRLLEIATPQAIQIPKKWGEVQAAVFNKVPGRF